MAKTKQKRTMSFPKTIIVKWEDPGLADAWLRVFESPEAALEKGETVLIATYELKEVRRGNLIPEIK